MNEFSLLTYIKRERMILLVAMLIHSLVWFLIDLVSAWGPDIITEKHKKWLQGNCIESGSRLKKGDRLWFSDTFYRNSYHHWRVSTTLIYFRFRRKVSFCPHQQISHRPHLWPLVLSDISCLSADIITSDHWVIWGSVTMIANYW